MLPANNSSFRVLLPINNKHVYTFIENLNSKAHARNCVLIVEKSVENLKVNSEEKRGATLTHFGQGLGD